MSRSFRKFPSRWNPEFLPPDWGSFRTIERKCIQKELCSIEKGDILFPKYYGSSKNSWGSSNRVYWSKKETRNEYFKEIRDILNGYTEKNNYLGLKYSLSDNTIEYNKYVRGPYDYQEIFINEFHLIKSGNNRGRGFGSCFQMLNYRKIKEEIKKWDGEPIDILYYLNHTGLIERAVEQEFKYRQRKW